LGIGDWGLGPIPNPQSPIPNPQSPMFYSYEFFLIKKIYIINLNIFKMENYNSNVVESDKSPNMHYDLLYKSNLTIQILYYYYYSNTSR
jgi:hypothetical protein